MAGLVAVEGIGLAVARWAELRGGASRAASVAPGGFTDADSCLAARPAGPPSRAPAGLGEVGFFSGCGCRIEEQGASSRILIRTLTRIFHVVLLINRVVSCILNYSYNCIAG